MLVYSWSMFVSSVAVSILGGNVALTVIGIALSTLAMVVDMSLKQQAVSKQNAVSK